MNDYLLQIAIGPIQDFISAARRTRDLWFGSTMLSEIAKAVALSVIRHGGRLIFPNAAKEELMNNRDLSVANVILAEVNSVEPEKLQKISDAARKAAKDCFRAYSDNAFRKMERWIDKERWEAQIKDVIEFYSAWVPMNGNYAEARKQVARLLAARKNIRDFEPNPCTDSVHKCALDGLRESVFLGNGRPSENEVKQFPKSVRVKVNEALDAVGLIKRIPAGGDENFPSVSRVAMDAWLRGKGHDFIERNKRVLFSYCDDLVKDGVLSRVMDKAYQFFPYEGVALIPSRHAAMMAEFGEEKSPRKEEVENLCTEIASVINGLPLQEQPPEPYLAFLCADGDRMGATLSKMTTAEEHREFSRELAKFAVRARDVVSQNQGVSVYTGGDDVMAFLPLDKALDCARELHTCFHDLMGKFGNSEQHPSLSVGISIAHAMEDLELLLEYGRKAESAAKKDVDGKAAERGKDRNGLAISVRSRGNIAITVRDQWKPKAEKGLDDMPLDQRVQWWAERFLKGEIPNKFPYELRENAAFYDGWKASTALKNAVKNDVMRIFSRKGINLSDDEKEQARSYIEAKVENAASIRALSDELILAQWIASGMEQAQPAKEPERKGDTE